MEMKIWGTRVDEVHGAAMDSGVWARQWVHEGVYLLNRHQSTDPPKKKKKKVTDGLRDKELMNYVIFSSLSRCSGTERRAPVW